MFIGYGVWSNSDTSSEFPLLWLDPEGERGAYLIIFVQLSALLTAK